LRDKGDHYEYVAVYVDDLLIASREPQSIIITALETTHKFKLKGSGPEFHLGCDFVRDEHGRLGYAPIKYIEKIANYERIFENASSPLVKR
jgi:hypothetical protein